MTLAPTHLAPRSIETERGLFSPYAVTSRSGPHITVQAGVLHADRFWTTTARSSLKARSVEAHHVASAILPDDGRHLVVSGQTTTVRPLRPLVVPGDPTAPLRAPRAILRLGLERFQQLIGYVEAAKRVPPDWLPHRRVLLVTKLDRTLTIDGFDVVEATGDWGGRELVTADGGASGEVLPHQQLPPRHRSVVRLHGRAHFGVHTPSGPLVLPARWIGEDRFLVSTAALSVVGAELPGTAAATFHDSTSRRPDEKFGVMFRGRVAVTAVDGPRTTLALRAERITTWDGFEAGTEAVDAA